MALTDGVGAHCETGEVASSGLTPLFFCGDLGIEGVKVIVPPDRYEALIDRLESVRAERGKRDSLLWFLSRRCDGGFLQAYIRRHASFVSRLHVGSYLYCSSELDVLLRLQEFGLLSEPIRANAANVITVLAVETPDAGCFSDGVQVLFTPAEWQALKRALSTELFPKLNETISDWRWNYDASNGTPEGHFDELSSAIGSFQDEFACDPIAVAQLEAAKRRIKETISDLESEHPQREGDDTFHRDNRSHESQDDARSVFDDVAD